MSGITLKESNPIDIPTPDTNKNTIFIDSTAVPPAPAYKDDAGVVIPLKGTIGSQGPVGPIGFGIDGEAGEFLVSQPGPQGNTGSAGLTGAQGPIGPVMFVSDGEDGEHGFPGSQGIQGATGSSGASDWDTTITKSVDDTVTNSATLTNDSELVTGALVSGGVYRLELFIIYSGTSATADYQWQLSLPVPTSGAVGEILGLTTTDAVSLATLQSGINLYPNGSSSHGTDASSTKRSVVVRISFTANAVTAIQFKFAQNTITAANSVKTYAGSYMRFKKVA